MVGTYITDYWPTKKYLSTNPRPPISEALRDQKHRDEFIALIPLERKFANPFLSVLVAAFIYQVAFE
jgi:hypothetical protein